MTKELYIMINAISGALIITIPLIMVFIGLPVSFTLSNDDFNKLCKIVGIAYIAIVLIFFINRTCGVGIAWDRFM